MENPLATDLDHILKHTADVWEELRGSRIFITGGTGFFGCWLLESFAWANDKLDLGAHAVVLTRAPEAFRTKAPHLARHRAIALHRGDICTFDFPAGRFSHVIHAATESASGGNELRALDSIVAGTRRALDFAVAAGAGKFLLTSSGAVYGKQPPELTHIPESYLGAPETADARSTYGEAKRAAELLCAIYHERHGLETKTARCFAFSGPHLPLNLNFAIGNFIGDVLAGRPIHIQGDGTPYRSYLYAADLAIWLWTILFRGTPARPYNVGSEEAISISELAQTVARTLAGPAGMHVRLKAIQAATPSRYVPSTGRARRELQLAQYVPLGEGIRRTAVWHLHQPYCDADGIDPRKVAYVSN